MKHYDDNYDEPVINAKSEDDDYIDPALHHCYACGIIAYGCPCGNCGNSEGEDYSNY